MELRRVAIRVGGILALITVGEMAYMHYLYGHCRGDGR